MAGSATVNITARIRRPWSRRLGTRLIRVGWWFLRRPYVETYADGRLLGTKPLEPRITIELGAFDRGYGYGERVELDDLEGGEDDDV